MARAYGLLLLKGRAGETYNVGSGNAVEIRAILDMIIGMSTADIEVKVDPNKIRPVDVPVIEADITKINMETGWKPLIPLRQTIEEILNYWREQIGGKSDE